MTIIYMNRWLYEITLEGERRLRWQEVDRISKNAGYYLYHNFLAFLEKRFPGARFKVDGDLRIIGRIRSWG